MKKILLALCTLGLSISQLWAQDYDAKPQNIAEPDLYKKDTSAFLINGEFLYWTADEGDLDYTIKQNFANGVMPEYLSQGDFQLADFEWSPGFRVLFGYFNAPKYWELKGQFTWNRFEGSDSVAAPSSGYLNSTFWGLIETAAMNSADSHIDLLYEVGDLLASRIFIPNPHLRIKMVGGFTIANIEQDWKVNYYFPSNVITNTVNKWEFLGGGFKIGVDVDWFLGQNFYLTGGGAASALTGRYKNTSYQKATNQTTPATDSFIEDHRIAYAVQFYFGPSYQRSYSCCRFEIFAGYELTSWFNLHEVYRNANVSSGEGANTNARIPVINNSPISLQGFTGRLTLNF